MRALELAADIATAYPFGLSARELKYFGVFSGNLVPGIEKLWPEETEAQLLRISDYGYRTNKVIAKESAEIIVCFFPIGRFLTPGFANLFLKKPALFFAPLQMFADQTLTKETTSLLHTIDPSLDRDELARAMPCYLRIVRETDFGGSDGIGSMGEQISKAGVNTCLHEFGLTRDTKDHTKIDLIGAPNCISEDNQKKFGNFLALDFISHMSLNSITVTVDGAMTVDTSSLVPKIDSVKFDSVDPCGSDELPCFWSDLTVQSGTRTGAILGSYATNGTVEIVEEKDLGLTDVKTVQEGSSDQVLNFSFKLTQPIPAGTKIHFKVTKPVMGVAALNAKTLESKLFEYVVLGKDAITVSPPQLDQGNSTVTLTSEAFATAPSTMTFKLKSPGGVDVPLALKSTSVDPTSTKTVFVLTIPAGKLTPFGCWKVVVSIDQEPVSVQDLAVAPTITRATIDTSAPTAKKIKIEGEGLNSVDCATKGLSFTLFNADESKTFSLAPDTPLPQDGKTLKFALQPAAAAAVDTTWKVKVTFAGKAVGAPLNLH
jgi:hypothetical protein